MNEKEKKIKDEAEDQEESENKPLENESDVELYEEMAKKNIDLQSFADELGKQHSKSKGLNIFGKKKKDDDSSRKVEQLNDMLVEKEEKIKDLESQLKAMVAENRNQKIRIENEFRTKIKFAVEDFFRDFITVKDDFDKAMEFVPQNEDNVKNPFIQGIINLHKKTENVLSCHGLQSYSAMGEQFDHTLHQAMSIIDVEDKEANEVVAEYMKGYKYHDRVLRAAMVVVASGKDQSSVKENVQDKIIDNDQDQDGNAEDNVSQNIEEDNKTE